MLDCKESNGILQRDISVTIRLTSTEIADAKVKEQLKLDAVHNKIIAA